MSTYVDEFRGTDKLVIAKVLTDDNTTGYTTDAVQILAPVAEIARTTETATDTKYYDNKPAMTINAEGADTITLTVPVLDIATLGLITGKEVDPTTGALMDGESTPSYFALGYRLKLTDGTYRYVWRYKGSFAIPDETAQTEDAGTDSNNQTLTFTGIATQHIFTKTGTAQKALVVDERDEKADVSTFFDTVTTCDTLQALVSYSVTNNLSGCSTNNSAATANAGSTYIAKITADEGKTLGAITVSMGGSSITSQAVAGSNIIIDEVSGDIVITCTAS